MAVIIAILIYVGVYFLFSFAFQQLWNQSVPKVTHNKLDRLEYKTALSLFTLVWILIVFFRSPVVYAIPIIPEQYKY